MRFSTPKVISLAQAARKAAVRIALGHQLAVFCINLGQLILGVFCRLRVAHNNGVDVGAQDLEIQVRGFRTDDPAPSWRWSRAPGRWNSRLTTGAPGRLCAPFPPAAEERRCAGFQSDAAPGRSGSHWWSASDKSPLRSSFGIGAVQAGKVVLEVGDIALAQLAGQARGHQAASCFWPWPGRSAYAHNCRNGLELLIRQRKALSVWVRWNLLRSRHHLLRSRDNRIQIDDAHHGVIMRDDALDVLHRVAAVDRRGFLDFVRVDRNDLGHRLGQKTDRFAMHGNHNDDIALAGFGLVQAESGRTDHRSGSPHRAGSSHREHPPAHAAGLSPATSGGSHGSG